MKDRNETSSQLPGIIDAILQSYHRHGEMTHLEGRRLPSRETIWDVVEDLLRMLFPGFLEQKDLVPEKVVTLTSERVHSVDRRLRPELQKGLRLRHGPSLSETELQETARNATLKILRSIPKIRDLLATDIEAAYEGDPAAKSMQEIIIAYPGLQAIAVYRLAHILHQEGIPLVPRVMTEYAHSRTGIDIHPGARIGTRFFIDHGTGVVVGETCTIGDNVKIYQGVTLGAKSFPKDARGNIIKDQKRHPDIEDSVTIYSGATILGDVRIGRSSVVGGNVWLTQSIPADTRIIVRPPQQVHIDSQQVIDYQI